MDTQQLIGEIDRVIGDGSIPNTVKAKRLIELARIFWRIIFPELAEGRFDEVSRAEREARWAALRERGEVDRTAHPELVRYVLNWPATGGCFGWLDRV
jgi:hypothetical protein